MSSNLELWNSIEKTNPAFTKKVSYGARSFTTIDAYYQMKIATEKFGRYGDGWGITIEKFSFHDDLLIYEAIFYYTLEDKKYEFPIASSVLVKSIDKNGKVKIDDECVKKVKTDALTKGFSFLGMNTDVFMGMFDDNRYIKQMEKEFGNSKHSVKSIIDLLQKSEMTMDEIKIFCQKAIGSTKASKNWTQNEINTIADAYKKKAEKKTTEENLSEALV